MEYMVESRNKITNESKQLEQPYLFPFPDSIPGGVLKEKK